MSSTSLREAVDVSHGEIQSMTPFSGSYLNSLPVEILCNFIVVFHPGCKPQGSGRSSAEEAHRQAQWQKQIDYGKNTLGYAHYLKLIPK